MPTLLPIFQFPNNFSKFLLSYPTPSRTTNQPHSIMALFKDDFLPSSVYNTLPNIREVSDVHQTHSADLSHLQSLLDKYDLSAKVCIKLVHIHFKLEEGEIMAFGDVNVPPHGPIPILGPTKPGPASKFYGSHYLVDEFGQLQAWEYMTTEGPDMSGQSAFVRDFCHAIIQRGLQHKFGLSLKSSVEEGGWTEFEYPEKRATFLVPDTIPIPELENSFNTTTEWPRECFKPVVHGISYKHCYHCKHPRRPETQPEVEHSFVEGVSNHDGLWLGDVKLDPASSFFGVVAAITAAA